MTKTRPLPTLSELQQSPFAVWLWDPDRLRIVWANRPAVEAFGAETLFDVLDLRFDAADEGIVDLAQHVGTLKDDEIRNARLQLAPFAEGAPFRARLHVHPLPDGRRGVAITAGDTTGLDAGEALRTAALEHLPLPVLIADRAGAIVDANQQAGQLFETGTVSLSDIVGGSEPAQRFLQQIAKSGIANKLVEAQTRFGRRALRVVGKRLDEEAIVLLLDDVTERRELERDLEAVRAGRSELPGYIAKPPAKSLTAQDQDAFARLGDAVRSAQPALEANPSKAAPSEPAEPAEPAAALAEPVSTAQAPAATATPTSPAAVAVAGVAAAAAASAALLKDLKTDANGRAAVHVPEIIKRSLDLSPVPTVLLQEQSVLYANRAAVKLCEVADGRDLLGHTELAVKLSAGSQTDVVSFVVNGKTIEAPVRLTSFPFTSGPATKAELLVLAETESKAPDAERAERRPPPADRIAAVPARLVDSPPLPSRESEPKTKPRLDHGPSAEELISILDTATDGIATLDAQGNILSLSAGAEAIFGLRQAEVLGKPIADLTDGEGPRLVRDYLSALGESGIAAVFNDGLEVHALTPGGGRIPIFLTIGVLGEQGTRLEQPGRAAFCAVFRDITQWKQTESELRAAKEEAERASAQKSDFLAKISHELRTPLNAILGFSEVMRTERFGEMPNPKYLGYANDIHSSGEHLLSLINDLLDLSKIETGKMELNFTSVNLAELTEHCLRLFEEDARARRIVVRRNFPPNLPNVVADLRSMKQVMLNLLSNAIKFTPPGGQVIMSGQLAPSGEFSLKVRDTGLGMEESELAVAMQPFGRIHADERPDIPGTGLGLPLTKALVEANRAQFSLTSNRGKGTLAEIVFPVNRVLGG